MKARFAPALTLALSAATGAAADERGATPVLIELFTSQGCSSCPPADRLAGRLAQRGDLVVLSFHVNYWDYIGWRDPFATEATTRRQYAYARALGQRGVYTPEMVIDGRDHVVGSDEAALRRAIARRRAALRRAAPSVAPTIAMVRDRGRVWVDIGAAPYDGEADVVLVPYDRRRETRVPRGENRGRTLANFNVARGLERIGSWRGAAMRYALDADSAAAARAGDGCAVIVQGAGTGPVLSAAAFDMTPGAGDGG